MCDYSLQHVRSKQAKKGDVLVSTKFRDSISRGFSVKGDPNVVACLLPGTQLMFERTVTFEPMGVFSPSKALADDQLVATFTKVNPMVQHVHHDALRFGDDTIVLVTRLSEGQEVKVLGIPTASEVVAEGGSEAEVSALENA